MIYTHLKNRAGVASFTKEAGAGSVASKVIGKHLLSALSAGTLGFGGGRYLNRHQSKHQPIQQRSKNAYSGSRNKSSTRPNQ